MFGSGLDASGLVQRILWDKNSPFTVKGMFPGQHGGVGAGVTLEHESGTINLITMHSLPKAEREQQQAEGARRSNLLVETTDTDNRSLFTLSPSIQQMISSVSAFIYVVKSDCGVDRVKLGMEEFKSMMEATLLSRNVPVLILCCSDSVDCYSIPCLDIIDELDVAHLKRPWQARKCQIDTLKGFLDGINWLMTCLTYGQK